MPEIRTLCSHKSIGTPRTSILCMCTDSPDAVPVESLESIQASVSMTFGAESLWLFQHL